MHRLKANFNVKLVVNEALDSKTGQKGRLKPHTCR